MLTTRTKKSAAITLIAVGGLLLGVAVGSSRSDNPATVQVAYATYPDFNDLAAFEQSADLTVFGTVVGDGVEFKDRGLVGGNTADTDEEGFAMRMVVVRVQESSPTRLTGTIRTAVTDVGLNGVSSDATLRNGDVVALMLESIDTSRSDLRGISAQQLYGVVGGRQGVFRSAESGTWIQDADPFEESARDTDVAPLIEATDRELIQVLSAGD